MTNIHNFEVGQQNIQSIYKDDDLCTRNFGLRVIKVDVNLRKTDSYGL